MKKTEEPDCAEIFIPDDFISIGSQGGNIGRFFWHNQNQLTIESWDSKSGPYAPGAAWWTLSNPSESITSEIPGGSAFIWRLLDWYFWIMF